MKLKKHYLKYKHFKRVHKHILRFGLIGYKIISMKRISKKREELVKFIILKQLKDFSNKKIKIWFFSNCFFNLTELPLESRMGKGKGEIKDSFALYKNGFLLFEIKGISIFQSIKLLNYLNQKKILKFKLIF